MKQAEMFPDMPYEPYQAHRPPRPAPARFYYIEAATGQRMMSADPFSGEVIFIPLDLGCPRIMLFNTRPKAQRYADDFSGVVHLFPYNLSHFFSK